MQGRGNQGNPPSWLTGRFKEVGGTIHRSMGDIAQGKWVSRLRDRGQIAIQFPRLCPLSELPTDTVPVCSNFAELPSLLRTQSLHPRVRANPS